MDPSLLRSGSARTRVETWSWFLHNLRRPAKSLLAESLVPLVLCTAGSCGRASRPRLEVLGSW
eukprot:4616609-Lingulodinium_polyedra.AAC.1